MECALVIGHSAKSRGAAALLESGGWLTEYEFNADLVDPIKQRCRVPITVYTRTHGLASLVKQINADGPDFIVSMHLNSSENPEAHGTEVLHYHRSSIGEHLAVIMAGRLTRALGTVPRNTTGVKPVDSEQRGGFLLSHTRAPAILCEPLFISNPRELDRLLDRREGLIAAYVDAIESCATELGWEDPDFDEVLDESECMCRALQPFADLGRLLGGPNTHADDQVAGTRTPDGKAAHVLVKHFHEARDMFDRHCAAPRTSEPPASRKIPGKSGTGER